MSAFKKSSTMAHAGGGADVTLAMPVNYTQPPPSAGGCRIMIIKGVSGILFFSGAFLLAIYINLLGAFPDFVDQAGNSTIEVSASTVCISHPF